VPPVARVANKVAAKKKVVKKVKAPSKKRAPTRDVENELRADGHAIVVGIDEVGRGAWAGPLMVGAAVVPLDRRVNGIRDSKMLTERERERIFDKVADWCTAWAVGGASHKECDELGMAAAQRLAARRAVEGLGLSVDAAVIDGNWDFLASVVPHTHMMVKADAFCLSVAAASILAKVTRDRIMRAEAEHFPHYAFESNKGYPCPRHKAGLHAHGPSAIHRRSWVFMDGLAGPSMRYHRPEQPTLF
jgi:ribonuclease HII